MYGLSPKEIIELRIKCLEPYVAIASKHGIERDEVIQKAEVAWTYAIKPLTEDALGITDKAPTS